MCSQILPLVSIMNTSWCGSLQGPKQFQTCEHVSRWWAKMYVYVYRLCTVGCCSFHNAARGLWCSTMDRFDLHLGSCSSSAPDHWWLWGSTWDGQRLSYSEDCWGYSLVQRLFSFVPSTLVWTQISGHEVRFLLKMSISLVFCVLLPSNQSRLVLSWVILATGLRKNSTTSPPHGCIQIAVNTCVCEESMKS